MGKRKIQVTLDEVQYQELARLAERDGKKLAAVVRESIQRYLAPEAARAKREALHELFALEARVPEDYGDWKREYSWRKVEGRRVKGDDPPLSDPRTAGRRRG